MVARWWLVGGSVVARWWRSCGSATFEEAVSLGRIKFRHVLIDEAAQVTPISKGALAGASDTHTELFFFFSGAMSVVSPL